MAWSGGFAKGGGGGGGGDGYGGGGFGDQGGYGMTGFGAENGGGGGFFPHNNSLNTSQSEPGTGRGPFKPPSSVVPMTIAGLKKYPTAADETMKIGNVEVTRVTLVAQVKRIKPSSGHMSFLVDDKSGDTLDVNFWMDAPEGRKELENIELGHYVRIYGSVKVFQEKVGVSAYSITPVTDLNELTMHMMEVLYSHAYMTKAAHNQPGFSENQGYNGQASNFQTNVPGALGGDFAGGIGGFENTGHSPVQADVLAYVKQCTAQDADAELAGIIAALRNRNAKEVTAAVEYLSQEGHLYQTINGTTYRAMV